MERIAAAVLLTRVRDGEVEVYLVERSKELRFFGGYQALPGGVRSPIDGPDDGSHSDLTALRRCALRETFEETGLLLDEGMAELGAVARQELRQQLLEMGKEPADETTDAWLRLLQHASGDSGLAELCRIKTPPFAPVRYDTVFFHTEVPAGQVPSIWEGELVDGAFVKPAEALAAWRRGEFLIVPPVVILLGLLAEHGPEEFPAHAKSVADSYRAGHLHRVQFTPGIVLASIETPTLPPATTTNCYLVGWDKLQIIDPGSPHEGEQRRLVDLIEQLLAEGAQLDSIVLTHHHPDHVGGVNALSQHYNLPVRGHPLTLSRLAPGFREGAPIEDRDTIELGRTPDGRDGWQLEAIFTPGHDRGHLCFRENRYDAVIVGDMLSTMSTIVIDPPEGHLATYMASLQRLLDEPMKTLYPAHGPAVPDGHALVRKYIRHRDQRQTNLRHALEEAGRATVEDLLPKVYWDVENKMYPIAARSLLAGLERLEEEGFAGRDGDAWTSR